MTEDTDETFTLTLSQDPTQPLPDGVEIKSADATATAKITELVLTATVSGSATVSEGDAAVFTVTLTGGTSKAPVVIDYSTTASTATAVDDFAVPSGKLTIPTAQPTGTITILTVDDDVLDASETLVVSLTGAFTSVGLAERGTPVRVETEIVDGDPVTVSVADVTVAEGDPAVFTVTLSGEVAADLAISYQTEEGTAKQVDDYVAVSGTALVAAGETTATFTVDTVEDEQSEVTETFTVQLAGVELPSGATLARNVVTATITDDDKVIVTLEGPTAVPEGSAATFTVQLTASRAPVVVDYTVGGTSTPGEDHDHTEKAGTLTIGAGTTTATIVIQTTRDDVLDRGETPGGNTG